MLDKNQIYLYESVHFGSSRPTWNQPIYKSCQSMLTHFDTNPFTPNTNPQKTVMFMSCVKHCHP